MKAYLASLALVSTLSYADCSKEQNEVIKRITEGIQTKATTICRDWVLFYKDTITHPAAIAVAKDTTTAVCRLIDAEVICSPMEADLIRKSYIETFIKKSI